MNGTLACFCDSQYSQYGHNAASNSYRRDGLDQIPSDLDFEVDGLRDSGSEVEENQICFNYIASNKFNKLYEYLI